jgi:hypothetical protein
MFSPVRVILAWIPLGVFALGIGSTLPLIGQEKESPKEPVGKVAKVSSGWTLDEAMAHLELYPGGRFRRGSCGHVDETSGSRRRCEEPPSWIAREQAGRHPVRHGRWLDSSNS